MAKTEKSTKRIKGTKDGNPRIRIPLDWDKLDAILQFKPSVRTTAEMLNMSHDTLERRIRSKHNMSFGEYRELKMGRVVLKLQQKAINKALDGDNTMLIFCLKNLCGWGDNPTPKIDDTELEYPEI